MNHKLRLFLFFVILSMNMEAQRYSGNHLGGYSGVYGIQENPASFVNKRPKWDVNIIGTGLYAYTEYGYIANQSVLSMTGGRNIYNASDSIPPDFNSETGALFYANNYSDPITGFIFNQTLHLPSFCFKVNNFSFGLFSNARFGTDAMNTPTFFNYLNLKELTDFKPYTIGPLTTNAMAWGEIGVNVGYAHELENENILSVGVNAKYLMGFEAVYLNNKSDYNFIRVRDTFLANDANLTVGFATGASRTNNDYNFGVNGTGLGLDLGVEYMIPNEDEESNSPHYMKFGAAVRDLGAITFNKNTERHDFAVNDINFEVLKGISYNRNHNYDIVKRLSAAVYSGDSTKSLVSREITMYTPTSLTAYWDYNFRPDFFVNVYATRRLKTLQTQLSAPNVFMLSARYEKRWFEAGASVSLTEDSWFGVGTYVRLGVLTIGSDHINTFIFSQPKLRGSDFYMSLKIMPFGSESERDKGVDRIGGGRRGGKTGCFKQR